METRIATCWAMVLAAAVAAVAAPDARVTTLDGQHFTGKLITIGAEKAEFVTAAGVRKVAVRDLWRVHVGPSRDVMSTPGKQVILLAAGRGEALAVTDLAVRAGKIAARSELLGRITLDVSTASAIYLPSPTQKASACRDRHKEMDLPRATTDYLIAKDDKGKWVPVPGVFKGIGAGKVSFELDGSDRTIDLGSVQTVQLAAVPSTSAPPAGRLVGRDGSVVAFESLSIIGPRMSMAAAGIEAEASDVSAVAEIHFGSRRCVYLSDLEPARLEQTGMFDVAFGYRRDRSTAGKPIRLAGQTYARGLGLHSKCELTYDLGGKFASLAALAGIDQAGGNRGGATLTVAADGKDLIGPLKLAASAAPQAVRCNLKGAKTLTITVDFGDDGNDVGDHVSLAEARLIKP